MKTARALLTFSLFAASAAAQPTAAAPRAISADSPIEVIAADKAGRAVLERDVPGLLEHPQHDSFKPLSLKDVEPLSDGKIADAMIDKVRADLASETRR